MNTNTIKRGGLFVLILALAFVSARAVWSMKAMSVASGITNILGDNSATLDTFTTTLTADLTTTRHLAQTCLFVAECTPKQASNALRLTKEEQKRLSDFAAYQIIYAQAKAAYMAGDDATLDKLKDPYIAAKMAIAEDSKTIQSDSLSSSLSAPFREIFNALDN
jgi:hypothetical protein